MDYVEVRVPIEAMLEAQRRGETVTLFNMPKGSEFIKSHYDPIAQNYVFAYWQPNDSPEPELTVDIGEVQKH